MSNNNRTRAHHYVPQFYLGHFTDTGARDGFLWAHHLQNRRSFRTRPSEVAHQRDFYMLELENTDPLQIEQLFSEQESLSAPIIRQLINHQIINRDEFRFLAGFLFLLLVRGPRMRIADTLAAQQGLSSTPPFPQNWHMLNLIRNYFANAEQIANWLITFDWSLVEAPQGTGEFICTDHPVILQQDTADNLHLFAPLSPELVFDVNLGSVSTDTANINNQGTIIGGTADAIQVATINRALLGWSNRFVFSRQNNFCWLQQRVGSVQDLFNALQPQTPSVDPGDAAPIEPPSSGNPEVQ